MPADFMAAIKRGARVRTKKLAGGKYIRIAFDKKTGKSYAGEVKKKKVKK